MKQRKISVKIKSAVVVAAVAATLLASGSAPISAMATSNHGHGGHSTPHHDKDKHHKDDHNKESQAATNLRAGLHDLLKEHVTTNLTVNRLIATGASQSAIDAGIEAQVANSDALSGAIASIYGVEAGTQFSELFLEHIDESNSFAVAAAAGDEQAKIAANEELQEYLRDLSTFFSTAIPVLSYDAVYALLLEHETLINKSTEAAAHFNFNQSKKFEKKAIRQVAVIADALASGIIATQPSKF